jgi:hypothetical protein
MRATGILAAAGAILLLTAPAASAATVALTFQVDVTASDADGFTPFSFLETWTLSPDHSAMVSDAPITAAMKALESPTTSFIGTFGNLIGETRDPSAGFRLNVHSVGGSRAFGQSLINTNLDHHVPPAFGPDLIPFLAAAGPFTFQLVGPIHGDPPVGETRDGGPGVIEVEYSGVANLVATPAPEPGTWMLIVTGFGLTGATLRARRRPAPVRAR